MTIVYTNQKSKMSKKKREARDALLKEQRAIKRSLATNVGTLAPSKTYRRETPHYPSLNS
jgi:hypothetical protein